MKIRSALVAVTAAAAIFALAGCTPAGGGTTTEVDAGVAAEIDAALAEITGTVLSTGPNGEEPSSVDTSVVTDEQAAEIAGMGLKAAIVMHYGGNDWANAQIDGLNSEFKRLGIQVIATTDADFDPATQVSQIETVLTQDPDIIVSIPTDPVATASAYRKAAEQGVKLVFMDNVPDGFVAGQDYVSMVSADNYGNGVTSAYLLARSLGGQGKIGVIYHEADFFVTKQRYEGFKDTITEKFPDIEIVQEQGIAGPDFAGDAQGVANAMLTKNADLDGIWAVWDVPAEGVMAAARETGRTDIKIATEDLGTNVAIALAKNQMVVGLGAQLPFDQGVAEADLAALSILGQAVPSYVALSSLPVDHENVLEAWEKVYGSEAPAAVRDAYVD
ncbi:MAG: sugar ABC transporter substrate-binding protein [Microbacterium sp. SCN 70-200]|uniref:substrate-binding domain-containing protein n=1 Tax=unclassified Microbacterium TaxID=2609290 RepID=UPI000868E582|nr:MULTISPECIES: substrate-binding domain-containing protein [unclassified Microbacterium]MBN9215312.1 substrate-binding domain-containing protein [Microbacterium sp.]ODT42711.1 MAG: sugar ABC transporter substrate-binding protein [Microbacterium sp. SCN 70-200]OJV79946.1 MAG: sugar ABC transporter substrate-binding protein [Microbacterium sp. 70-16]